MHQADPISEVPTDTTNAPNNTQTDQENPGTSTEGNAPEIEQINHEDKPEVLFVKPLTGLLYTDSLFGSNIAS